jgi:hypothetical protein
MATHTFNKLGQTILPKVFGKLNGVGLTDLMDIKGETTSAGTGGGRIRSAETNVYQNVPVVYEPKSGAYRFEQANQITSTQDYILKFPTHAANGSRYNIDPRRHRLVVKARTAPGDEPAKTFRIISIRDVMGNIFEAECVMENV